MDVDVHCPDHLFDKFKDLPCFPTREKLSESEKLVLTLYPKKHYVCTSRYLKFCLRQGYILDKLHQLLFFEEDEWLKPFIDKNTDLRTKATSEFEKALWKKLSNSNYGKMIENVEKRVNIRYETRDTVNL